jgi:hypothetical protein
VIFNPATIDQVDRVIVLRIVIDEDNGLAVEDLLDCSAGELAAHCGGDPQRLIYRAAQQRRVRPVENLQVTAEAQFRDLTIRQYESGTIQLLLNGQVQPTAKPHLREIAAANGVDLLNGSSVPQNTRQLGADIIKNITARRAG